MNLQDDCTFYRQPFKTDSGHLEFWEDALAILDSMKFVAYKNVSGDNKNVESVKENVNIENNDIDQKNGTVEAKNIVNKLKVKMQKDFKSLDDVSQNKMLSSIKENLNTFFEENGNLIEEGAKVPVVKKPIVTKFDSKTNQRLAISDEEKDQIIETFVRKIKKKNGTNGKTETKVPKSVLTEHFEKDKTYFVFKNTKLGIVHSYKKGNGKAGEENVEKTKFSSPDRVIIDDPMGDIFITPEETVNDSAAVDDEVILFRTENKPALPENADHAPSVRLEFKNQPKIEDCNTETFKDEFVAYWMLNVLGIKAIIDNLQEKRFKCVKTKNFNVDNIHDFVGLLKVLNEVENNVIHEARTYNVIQKNLALYCLAPKVSIILC